MNKNLTISGIGEFKSKNGSYYREIQFQNQTIPVIIAQPTDGSKRPEGWEDVIKKMYNGFVQRAEQELFDLPNKVRELCREYEMYDGLPIPWTDEELLSGLKWYNVVLCDYRIRTKDGLKVHRFIECCTEPALEKLNNFSLLFGFDEDIKLDYAHFDG